MCPSPKPYPIEKNKPAMTCSSEHDLALVKFAAHGVPFLRPRNTGPIPAEGDKVIVIGNPSGLTGTVSEGIISAFRENGSVIQINAPISPGSSGSPVLDGNGKVIGVATSQNQKGQNLNFAIADWVIGGRQRQRPCCQNRGGLHTSLWFDVDDDSRIIVR